MPLYLHSAPRYTLLVSKIVTLSTAASVQALYCEAGKGRLCRSQAWTLIRRWASRLKPATLQLLMRHRSIETTMKYYVDQDADEVADELWATHEAAQIGAAK